MIFFSFKTDFKRPTNPILVLDMARAPSVAIPHKVDRSKPNLSKALRTSEKILVPVVVSFIHCSDRSSSVSFNSLSTPFINIANCAASFTSGLPNPSDRIKPKEGIKAKQFHQLENIFSSKNHGVL